MPCPTDLFDAKLVEEKGLTEEDCVNRLIEAGMPQKMKEKKISGEDDTTAAENTKGGAEVFIPKIKTKKTKFPKSYDPSNPGQMPDPERWLPKWQRSRFKKLAKKKGIYLKGGQGDAQVDTDVTGGIKGTAHKDAASQPNKRRRKN